MADDTTLPRIRPDLIVQPLSDLEFVVKLRARKQYFRVGPQEAFLLEALQQPQTRATLVEAYRNRFQEKLSKSDVKDFIALAQDKKLLIDQTIDETPSTAQDDDDEDILATNKPNLLFYRIPLFNPDAALTRWEPHLRWIWTRGFLCVSALGMLAALFILWSNRSDLVTAFPAAVRWETVVVA